MKPLLALALLVSSTVFAQEPAKIEIESPWTRATAPGSKLAAGYMVLRNRGDSQDRLVGASSPLAAKIETHITLKDGNIMRMREVPGYALPPRGGLDLKPGGAHLMLVDIKQPFKEGDKVPLTLRFERAGKIEVELQVLKTAPPPVDHKH